MRRFGLKPPAARVPPGRGRPGGGPRETGGVRGGGVGGNSSSKGPGVGGMANGDSGGGGGGGARAGPGVGGMSTGASGGGVGGGARAAAGGGGGMVVGRRAGRGGGKPGGIGGGGGTSGPTFRTRVGASFSFSSSSIGIMRSTGALAPARSLPRGSDLTFFGPTEPGLTTSLPLTTYKLSASTTPMDAASFPSSSLAGIFCVEG